MAKILIVDDAAFMRKVIRDMLAKNGYDLSLIHIYKPGRVTFKESIYSTQAAGSDGTETLGGTNPRQTGYGCSVGTIDLDMSTVNMESTGNARDAGIQGDGFFLLGDKNGVGLGPSYTDVYKRQPIPIPWTTPPKIGPRTAAPMGKASSAPRSMICR